MTLVRALGGVVTLVLLACLLPQSTALATPTATATATSAGSSLRSEADTDADGLADSVDGCPTAASANPTGCPTAQREVRLRRVKGLRMQARVISNEPDCVARTRIKIYRVRTNRDFKVTAVDAAWSGKRRFSVERGGTYYAVAASSYASGKAECARAASGSLLVRRR